MSLSLVPRYILDTRAVPSMFLQNLEGRGSRGSGGENMLIDDEGGPVTTRFAKRAHSDVPRRLSPQRRMVGGHAAATGQRRAR